MAWCQQETPTGKPPGGGGASGCNKSGLGGGGIAVFFSPCAVAAAAAAAASAAVVDAAADAAAVFSTSFSCLMIAFFKCSNAWILVKALNWAALPLMSASRKSVQPGCGDLVPNFCRISGLRIVWCSTRTTLVTSEAGMMVRPRLSC